MMMIRRVVRYLLIAAAGSVVLFYVAFAALLTASERQWLGKAPAHAAIDVRSREAHEIELLDGGIESLAARLRLMEQATKSIDLEFFIYELDTTSRLVSQLLARKAREGVRVRILVDFASPVFKLRPAYAAALKAAGVEVKYYNTAGLLRFFAVQHRTHRKLLAVDGRSAIVGGRNIADDYFDVSEHYNFLDCDVRVTGPVVAAIQESFDLYWSSGWSADPERAVGDEKLGEDFLRPRAEEKALALQAEGSGKRPFTTTCNDLHFVTDYPGAGVERRRVYGALATLSGEAKSEILLESPYFVLQGDGADLVHGLLERGVRLQVLTNSLRSTDAFYTVAALLPGLGSLEHPGFRLWAYRGDPPPSGSALPPRSRLWGVHAKRGVFDGTTTVIGTYNIDPRSANLNAEMILVCRDNPALAAEMARSIEDRIARSTLITGGAGAAGIEGLLRGASVAQMAKMAASLPLVHFFSFLL
jgi:putative cardiolipin synthase